MRTTGERKGNDPMEKIGYIYALVVEVIKGNITAEEALEKIRKSVTETD